MEENENRGSVPWRAEEIADLNEQIAYWRGMYQIMVRILAEQHDDPCVAWLDEIVNVRFSKLL